LNTLKNHNSYSITLSNNASTEELSYNSWIVILHSNRIPPHIGILINGSYNSLTIKGPETNVDVSVLLKIIKQKKIETVFIKLKKHPVFSLDYQNEIFQIQVKKFTQVKPNEASCLSPIKLFLTEFYAIQLMEKELLYELVERLKENDYLDKALGLNIKNEMNSKEFYFPIYSYAELQDVILKEQTNLYKK